MAHKTSAWLVGLVGLQLLFAVIIPIVTSTSLDDSAGDCQLNLIPGRVCDFVYVTAGFSLFFSLLLLAAAWVALRQPANSPASYLTSINASLALFGTFWWMVCAITISLRGQQAQDAGQPGTTSRNAVIGLTWIQFVLFLVAAVAVIYDRIAYRQYRVQLDKSASKLQLEEHAQFKQSYTATQALGSTPLV